MKAIFSFAFVTLLAVNCHSMPQPMIAGIIEAATNFGIGHVAAHHKFLGDLRGAAGKNAELPLLDGILSFGQTLAEHTAEGIARTGTHALEHANRFEDMFELKNQDSGDASYQDDPRQKLAQTRNARKDKKRNAKTWAYATKVLEDKTAFRNEGGKVYRMQGSHSVEVIRPVNLERSGRLYWSDPKNGKNNGGKDNGDRDDNYNGGGRGSRRDGENGNNDRGGNYNGGGPDSRRGGGNGNNDRGSNYNGGGRGSRRDGENGNNDRGGNYNGGGRGARGDGGNTVKNTNGRNPSRDRDQRPVNQ